MEQIGNELKKILMAGIGAVTTTVEKSQEVIDRLAQKGEITFEQAKTLSVELADKVKTCVDNATKVKPEDVIGDLQKMTQEQREQIKQALDEIMNPPQQPPENPPEA